LAAVDVIIMMDNIEDWLAQVHGVLQGNAGGFKAALCLATPCRNNPPTAAAMAAAMAVVAAAMAAAMAMATALASGGSDFWAAIK
jgi:hypothetical protein